MAQPGSPAAALELFHPVVQNWFLRQGGLPTEIQARAWPEIAAGRHVLVSAPTGSGKTLTAFLWAIHRHLFPPASERPGRVLYVSPLKALNNDIRRNLAEPLAGLRQACRDAGLAPPEIRTAVRSGDTDPAERRAMLRHPPEILITTPESFNLLLGSTSGRSVLAGVGTVILDEIHAVADTKRGTFLMLSVERLALLAGEFQRIALSATVQPPDEVAAFVGGRQLVRDTAGAALRPRPVAVIQSGLAKRYEIEVDFPEAPPEEASPGSWWDVLTESYRRLIGRHRSTLIFANSRRMVEKLARFINEAEGATLVYAHHGSLSHEVRTEVEQRLKNGELAGIVATSSLELGIDIGAVDRVVLAQTPRQIASAIPRVGRAGHQVGETSRATFLPVHPRDLLEAAVVAAHLESSQIEPCRPPRQPLDVLAQALLAMTAAGERPLNELFLEIGTCHSFRGLGRAEFDLVVEMLAGRYADGRVRELTPRLAVDRLAGTARARPGVAALLNMSGGVIPDRGYFTLRLSGTGARLGELDEEFVWERSLGDTFPLGNQVWRILRITANDVEVSPIEQARGLVPFWRAGDLDRAYHLSERVGRFLEAAAGGLDTPEFFETLRLRHHLTPPAARALLDFLRRQREATGARLPHRHHVVAEHYTDPATPGEGHTLVLHTFWGGAVNRPLGLALAAAWERAHGKAPELFIHNDCLLLTFPRPVSARELLDLAPPAEIPRLLRETLESTSFFGARFRENAQRAMLLPRRGFGRRTPLWWNRLRAKKLLAAVAGHADFPILLETWRGCLEQDFDLDTLRRLLDKLRSGEIRLSEVATRQPSPFAAGVLWRQTGTYMYADDAPGTALRSSLSDALLRDMLHSTELRPRLDDTLVGRFVATRQRLAPGYSPSSPGELLEWVKERLFIPAPEWLALLAAGARDHGPESAGWPDAIRDRLRFTAPPDGPEGVSARENQHRLERGLEGAASQGFPGPAKGGGGVVETSPSRPDLSDAGERLAEFVGEWLRGYGPVTPRFIAAALGVEPDLLAESLRILAGARAVVIDEIRRPSPEEPPTIEVCDSANLEILLRMRRREAQPASPARPAEALPLWLAHFQGLTRRETGLDALQRRLESLFGYPARAELWESDLLPSRLEAYAPALLDEAQRTSDLGWFGCGRERLGFCFRSDLELFRNEAVPPGPDSAGETFETGLVRQALAHSQGRLDLAALTAATGLETGPATRALWALAWSGQGSIEDFGVIRQGIARGFQAEPVPIAPGGRRRLGFQRWRASRPWGGAWFALGTGTATSPDAMNRQEWQKDQARLVLLRYGVVFRELLAQELPGLHWRDLFQTLYLLELSGEICSGHFFEGIPGIQFCSAEAIPLLEQPLPEEAVFWLNATDPASLCGVELSSLREALPPRVPSTHLVYHGQRLVVVSRREGRDLTITVPADSPRLASYLAFFRERLARGGEALKRIVVETVNNEPAPSSPYRPALQAFGFRVDFRSLVLWRELGTRG